MRTSDAHLEKALKEYNAKVADLEKKGDSRELLDAYINRGCVLSMLDSFVSAITDFDEAADIIDELEKAGIDVDPGYVVKTYVSRGELQTEKTCDTMAEDYRIAASRLDALRPGCRYYDERNILEMCINCAGDLIDNGYSEDSVPFIEKGFSLTDGKDDKFSLNVTVELLNLATDAYKDMDENEKAYGFCCRSVKIADGLYLAGDLEDPMDLVGALVTKGDFDEFFEKKADYFADREAVLDLMEDLNSRGALDDLELLSSLHGETAQAYLDAGNVAKAEKHLMKQVSYNLNGSSDYMQKYGIEKK